MAIEIFKRDVDKIPFEEIVTELEQKTNNLRISEDYIKQIEAKENELIKKYFGVSMTTGELKERIKNINIQNNFLSNLGGAAVEVITNTYKAHLGDEVAKEQEDFRNFLNNELDMWQPEIDNPTLEDFILYIVNKTYDFSREEIIITDKRAKGTGKVTSLPTLRGKDLEKINEVFLSKLASVTQARIRAYMKKRKYNIGDKKFTGDVEKGRKYELNIKPPFDWYNFSGPLTEEITKIKFSKQEIYEINIKFKKAFKQYINDSEGSIPYLDQILDYVLVGTSDNPSTAIFVGGNEKNIIGLCGEIRALCYLSLLLGDKFSLGNSKLVSWTARQKDNGKSFHADIILDDFGFQVKNSVDELFKTNVSFVDSKLSTFLNKIDSTLTEKVLTLYESYYFNVPYKAYYSSQKQYNKLSGREVTTPIVNYAQVNYNEQFASTRKRILLAHAAADVLLNELVGNLLYITVDEVSKKQKGNIVFFVGKEILFASDILWDIIKHIYEEISNFNVNIKYDSSYTIVNFLEENDNVFKYQFNKDKINIYGFLDEQVSKEIIIKSSYNFNDLLRPKYY